MSSSRSTSSTSGPFSACPECGSRMSSVSDGWSTLMYCRRCDAYWRFNMGWVARQSAPEQKLCIRADR